MKSGNFSWKVKRREAKIRISFIIFSNFSFIFLARTFYYYHCSYMPSIVLGTAISKDRPLYVRTHWKDRISHQSKFDYVFHGKH